MQGPFAWKPSFRRRPGPSPMTSSRGLSASCGKQGQAKGCMKEASRSTFTDGAFLITGPPFWGLPFRRRGGGKGVGDKDL